MASKLPRQRMMERIILSCMPIEDLYGDDVVSRRYRERSASNSRWRWQPSLFLHLFEMPSSSSSAQ